VEVELYGHVVGELEGRYFAGGCCGFDDFGEVAEAVGGFGGFLGLEVEEGVAAFLECYGGAHEVSCGLEG